MNLASISVPSSLLYLQLASSVLLGARHAVTWLIMVELGSAIDAARHTRISLSKYFSQQHRRSGLRLSLWWRTMI
jgi:hypothetical protein